MQTQAQKELYTYEEAAAELTRSPFTIRKAVSAGILHPIKLPHDNRKFIRVDEIEWYRNRELSLSNAELFRQHQSGTLEYPSFRQLGDAFKEFLESPEFEEIVLTLYPVFSSYAMRHADPEQMDYLRKGLREDMQELAKDAQYNEKSRNLLDGLARRLTETLTRKDLTFVQRKTYRELLDATLDSIANEPIASKSNSA
jgi:hypothetical protein